MGTLAVDIETASPFQEPNYEDFNDTSYFELVAIALGYQSTPDGEIETTVLFRDGGWDDEHTANLLKDAVAWCHDHEIDRTLTYNGDGFDAVHLRNWASQLVKNGVWDSAVDDVETLLVGHDDLKHAATEQYGHCIPDWKDFPKFEKFCEWEGIEPVLTYYEDYDIDPDLRATEALDAPHVEGRHIGQVLGEAYVNALANGVRDTTTAQELKQLMRDYATADIEPLFELGHTFSTTPSSP